MNHIVRNLVVVDLAALLLIVTPLFVPKPAFAAATLVQSATGVTNGGTSVSATYLASPTAGNLLIAVCGVRASATITGPSGFTTAINEAGTPSQAIFYKVSAGTESGAQSCGSSVSGRLGIAIFEYSGMTTASPLDAVNTVASTGNSTSPASGSVTTATASTLLVGGLTTQANTTFTSWTNSFTEVADFANGGAAASRASYAVATSEVSTTGTYSTVAAAGTGAWRGQIAAFKVAPSSVLSTDIVDSGGATVGSPSAAFGAVNAMLLCQASTGTLGSASQKIRTTNTTANGNWTLTIAATSGATSTWTNGTTTYDYNDGGGSPAGCADSADTDSRAGQLTVDASPSAIAPQSGCATTGIAKGASTAFAEGSVNSITLLTATASQTNCYYDLTGVALSQQVPPEIPASGASYSLSLTITVTAN